MSPLAGLPRVTTLDLSNNPTLKNVAVLASMQSLEALDLSYCAVEDYAFTLALPKLRTFASTNRGSLLAANAATFATLRERGVEIAER